MTSSGANVGLAITQALGLTGMVQLGIKQTAALENSMTSVERIAEYASIDAEEADFQSDANKKPSDDWPEKGEIEFEKLSLRYCPDSQDKVLNELSFRILPQEKVGIVGRTGENAVRHLHQCHHLIKRSTYFRGRQKFNHKCSVSFTVH